ncbi:PEP-CTERM sorting domain-containing protein [uncultured Sphingosinicella sp.]|jgi:hypothetical protein|uniref:PEP-CTERM sorting domain-containing protein n=1 Tax=uncultured Sphingosinicella sp. TaxID=478748 RepID=UPI0030D98F47|tara:strand:+ start:46914 stop:47708 length:795 start_codon:yes stop_codon:yes gene_type:complete
MRLKLLACASALLATPAIAAPVDLTGWQADVLDDVAGNANWAVQPGNDSVLQTVNGLPTIFFKDGASAQGLALSGSIKVTTTGDDDYVGFVLGYSDGEINSSSANFILIDWKQSDQFSGNMAYEGLSISHVSGNAAAASEYDFWGHEGVVNELKRGTTLGSTGWDDNAEYTFDLIFLPDLIQVKVGGVLELSLTAAEAGLAAFDNGSFGFYNYSQSFVLYAGITEDVAPDPDPEPPVVDVPEPGMLGLFGLGFVGMGLLRRRRG